MLRFSLNLSMLFQEVPFLQRFRATAEAGFAAVEFLWPSGVDLDALARVREASGLTVALFNVDAGDMVAGDRGFACWPEPGGGSVFNPYILAALEATGYAGYVGLEYTPLGSTLDSFDWIAPELRAIR